MRRRRVVVSAAAVALLAFAGLMLLTEPGRARRQLRRLVRQAQARLEPARVVTFTGGDGVGVRLSAVEVIFDAEHGLAGGWMDFGWSPHEAPRGGPLELDLSRRGGLILARPGLPGSYGGLTFRYRAPASYGDFLEVQLGATSPGKLPRVRVGRGVGEPRPDGFTEVWLPVEELDPEGRAFDRVVFHAWRDVGPDRVLLDAVALTAEGHGAVAKPRSGRFRLDCGAPGRPISPLIYGIAGFADEPPYVWSLGASARRWGGDATTRYNWELGDAWNLAYNWYFRNMRMSQSKVAYEAFLEQNREHGVSSAVAVPMLGWVAKDTTSYSYPVSVFGPQQSVGWDHADAGNGVARDGRRLAPGPPTLTSVRSTPESVERWVRRIRASDVGRGRSVHEYILDNEPMSWSGVHRDVHPEPVGYEELLEKTIAYATAIRHGDPEATIAGPAESDWVHFHYSAKDMASRVHWDRLRHGNVPLIPWYLRQIRRYEEETGTRILDVLDVHHYSYVPGVGPGREGRTDRATAALRIRQTRSLWDQTYVDESWLDEPLAILPLLRRWIEENHPGLGISIGEWSFGAEEHMSGGLATAEALGRFGVEGVSSAFYWTYPVDRSPAFWAFRAYRNFDGQGGRFLDHAVQVGGGAELASLFASRDEGGRRLVAVLLNHDPRTPLSASVELPGCGAVSAARAFTYRGGGEGFELADVAAAGSALAAAVAPYSITVLDLTLGARQP